MSETTRGPGRPKADIDMVLVQKLASIHCTLREIADIIGVDKETIRNRCGRELELGKAQGKASLRRRQWEVAESGNATMLIWLGKQYLEQSDSPNSEDETNMILPWDDEI